MLEYSFIQLRVESELTTDEPHYKISHMLNSSASEFAMLNPVTDLRLHLEMTGEGVRGVNKTEEVEIKTAFATKKNKKKQSLSTG